MKKWISILLLTVVFISAIYSTAIAQESPVHAQAEDEGARVTTPGSDDSQSQNMEALNPTDEPIQNTETDRPEVTPAAVEAGEPQSDMGVEAPGNPNSTGTSEGQGTQNPLAEDLAEPEET